jgi:excisionase family DNA binding protein
MTSSADIDIRPAVLTKAQAAKYLAISEVTLSRLIKAGDIPHTRVGKSLRFRIVDLDEYLEANTTRKWKQAKPGGPGL